MTDSAQHRPPQRRRRRARETLHRLGVHRLLFVGLLAILVVFAVWCVFLLARAQGLNGELDRHFGWLDAVRVLRSDLDLVQDAPEALPPSSTGRFEAFLDRTDALVGRTGDQRLVVEAQKLRLALGQLTLPEGDGDAAWQSATTALGACEVLETEVLLTIASTRQRLDEHWHSLYLLVFLSLALAASNFAFLLITHRRRRQVEEAHALALESASHDPLTKLWNREGILRLLGRELVRAQRARTVTGVVLADIDHFQQVNELLGQDQGDFVLQQVAKRLESLVRPYDTMGRFGGDSFLIVLPDCDENATAQVVERLRQAVNERDVEHAFGHIRVTVSLAAMTVSKPTDTSVDQLLLRLQEALGESLRRHSRASASP